jgi:nucleoside-diphosphate-sugar epimerase
VRVFVTGATGVLGMAAIAALQADGHEVTGLARNVEKAAELRRIGADACTAPLFDVGALTAAVDGHQAVCNLATHIPVGVSGMRRGAWKVNDRLRVEGSRIVSEAARAAGVRRLVQESVSLLYADMGDDWITEESPLSVTGAVEPSAVAESNATAFESPSRISVVLRFGVLVGDDPTTRWRIAQARAGRPIGFGDPHGWMHVVHPDDAGRAVAAALTAPTGVYNVGAEPVRRHEVTRVIGELAGRPHVGLMPRLVIKLAGERMELLMRSHRVSSDRFHEATGWKPLHHDFDASWVGHEPQASA